MRLIKIFFLVALWSVVFLPASSLAQQNDTTKPWVFWHWVQGGISKYGITADLEAMKANGIGGAYLMTIKGSNASNPPLYDKAINQLTPQWWEMIRFAFEEAKRLDFKLGMHVSDGFALAGGPWITPELSMQKIVSSKLQVKGGNTLSIKLPQPLTNEGYYKDIEVYAYPSPIGSGISTQNAVPKVSTSNGLDASGLINPTNKQSFTTGEATWIQYEFQKQFTLRSIKIKTSGMNAQSNRLLLEVSNDGKTFRRVSRLEVPRHGWQDTNEDYTHAIIQTTAKYFRFHYNPSDSEPGSEDLEAAKWKPTLKIVRLELSSEAQIGHYEGKNASVWRVSKRTTEKEVPSSLAVPMGKMINLTSKLTADGTLKWTAPAGNWTILRIGHTSTGQKNATGGGGLGLECDKFNPKAIKLQFDSWFGEALKYAGPEIAGKALNTLMIESWECGSQNWSPVFKDEFEKRRGYDLTPYLPILTGLPVQDIETSENFLYDVRKTIAELLVDQFFGTISGLTAEKGIILTAESTAPTMVGDGLMHYNKANIPMGEFWLNSPTHDKPNDMLDAISGAHIYGKNVIEAEAFTTVRMDWNESPGNMKTLQDRNYALGLNKLSYHVYVQNPWQDRKPGMTLDGVGLYFQRDQTWWRQGKAWVDYATRSQKLLQEGKPVADVAVFTGEELPRRSVLPHRLVPALPYIFGEDVIAAERERLANVNQPTRQIPAGVTHSANLADPDKWVNPLRGYAYDSFNPDVLHGATVKDKAVIFPSGSSYKLLIIATDQKLNPNKEHMSYQTLKKLVDLVKAGASIVVADKPKYQIGVKQHNKLEFDRLANELWDGLKTIEAGFSKPVVMKALGLGKVYKAPFSLSDFNEIGISRDFSAFDRSSADKYAYAKGVAYTHRKSNSREIYFISNQQERERNLKLDFRVCDKVPVVYNAVTDEYSSIEQFSCANGTTTLNLKFAPNESLFVVFDDKANVIANINRSVNRKYKTVSNLSTDWQVKFDSALGGPSEIQSFKTLVDWTKHPDSNINYYSGTALYTKNLKLDVLPSEKMWINLGAFSSIAEVKVNGIACGILWTAPFKVDITKALKKGDNVITIEVTNTWANRLIGDHNLPENKRLTKTTAPFRLAGKPLNPAGLFGPVTLEIEDK